MSKQIALKNIYAYSESKSTINMESNIWMSETQTEKHSASLSLILLSLSPCFYASHFVFIVSWNPRPKDMKVDNNIQNCANIYVLLFFYFSFFLLLSFSCYAWDPFYSIVYLCRKLYFSCGRERGRGSREWAVKQLWQHVGKANMNDNS